MTPAQAEVEFHRAFAFMDKNNANPRFMREMAESTASICMDDYYLPVVVIVLVLLLDIVGVCGTVGIGFLGRSVFSIRHFDYYAACTVHFKMLFIND